MIRGRFIFYIWREKDIGRKLETRSRRAHIGEPRVKTSCHACFRSRCVGGPAAEHTQTARRGRSAISHRRLISLPPGARVRQIVFRNPERDREVCEMTCVRAQHARFIYHRPDNALKCSDCNIVVARESERETESGRGSEGKGRKRR